MNISVCRKAVIVTGIVAVLLLSLAMSLEWVRAYASFLWVKLRGGYTVAERIEQFGDKVAARLGDDFQRARLLYPPCEAACLVFKDTRTLELYARMSTTDEWRFVRRYPVLGASGKLGPKLAKGDNQVPEGLYGVEYLNPNSRYHVALGLNYPNESDRRRALQDGRTELGGGIMIHGGSLSVGCVAVGDRAAEDLFILAALVSKECVQVLICPADFRLGRQAHLRSESAWVDSLYDELRSALRGFPPG